MPIKKIKKLKLQMKSNEMLSYSGKWLQMGSTLNKAYETQNDMQCICCYESELVCRCIKSFLYRTLNQK